MTFGVATDDKLRIKIKGEVQQNLFAAGSVLSGSNTIHEVAVPVFPCLRHCL